MAVAATINVLFMSFSCFRWVLVVEPKGWADEKVLRYQ
jgi:hypothetical protein